MMFCFLANAQNTIEFSTQVVEEFTEEPIFYAHIINLRTLKGDICDVDGKFTVDVFPSDTIRVSAIGFKTFISKVENLIDVDGSFKKIELGKGIYELNEILIRYIPPPEKFKEAFLALELDNPSAEVAKNLRLQKLKNDPAVKYNAETGMVSYNLGSPITYLYNKLSKKQRMLERSRIKLEKYNVYENHLSHLAEVVTGFNSKQDIDEFLRFCNLEVDFIKQHNDYDLVIVLNNFFMDYLSN